jgi:ParB-like chromosome segregation protein Spo0J
MQVHAIADELPPLSADETEVLVEDMRLQGQLVPAIVDEKGLLLDGRHRLIACQRLGLELRTEVFIGTDEEKRALSRSLNDIRRHLSDTQRSLRAHDAAKLKRGTNQHAVKEEVPVGTSSGITISQAAKDENVSVRSVKRVKYVSTHGIEELQTALRAEKVSLAKAEAIAKLTPEEQRKCIENGFKLPKKSKPKPKPAELKPVVEEVESPPKASVIVESVHARIQRLLSEAVELMQSSDKSSDEAKETLKAFNQSNAAACSYFGDLKPIEPPTVSVKVPRVLFPDAEEERQQRLRTVPTDAEFEAFWKAFPCRVNKGNARKAFTRAFGRLRKTMNCEQVIAIIMSGTNVYATHANPERLCHPTTWLNGDRWTDEAESIWAGDKPKKSTGNATFGTYTDEERATLQDAVF